MNRLSELGANSTANWVGTCVGVEETGIDSETGSFGSEPIPHLLNGKKFANVFSPVCVQV